MYAYKEKYVLDFSKVQYLGEVHKIIKEELDFPDYYGENWDACWDCLTDMVGIEPMHIELIGIDHLQKKFPRHANLMLKVFKDLKHCYNDKYIKEVTIEIVINENARYEIN